ncbi:hypothetical protein GCM10023156_27560 [Novipirellula rosea]|uniref:Uncharacterized protein n=1 Tax=Novipirellula rosea TaxID=1031540 RepID=A0ABP8MTP9_9BACT
MLSNAEAFRSNWTLRMQDALDQVLQFGQFAMLVIAVSVGIMLLLSIVDRHPRDKNSHDERDSRK